MILILFQRGGNNNAFLVQNYCIREKISHVAIDADSYGEDKILWQTHVASELGEVTNSVTGVYNTMYRHAGTFSVSNIQAMYQQFAIQELHDTLLGSLSGISPSLWMNFPSAVYNADLKLLQLRTAQSVGFEVPETIVTNSSVELHRFWDKNKGVITKAVKVGRVVSSGAKHTVLFTNRVTANHLEKATSHMNPPVLFQQEITKKQELRVVVVDEEVFACSVGDASENVVDWRKHKKATEMSKSYQLPTDIMGMCKKMLKMLNLRFAVFDIIEDVDGKFYFLELNQQGGWGWMETKLGMPISETIVKHLV